MKRCVFLTILISWILFSCKENSSDVVGEWESSPLSGFVVIPINGGARITYDIPDDPEINYIEAQYIRKGKQYTEKSSIYKNEIIIEGFNTEDPVEATLYKVNRKGQRSKPVTIEFVPLISPIKMIYNSLKLSTTFGGILAEWENSLQTELGVRFMVDSMGVLETKKMYYTTIQSEKYNLRGFPDSLITFAVSLEDKWGNISDTIVLTTKPYFETEIKKPYGDMRKSIPYDNITDLSGSLDFKRI